MQRPPSAGLQNSTLQGPEAYQRTNSAEAKYSLLQASSQGAPTLAGAADEGPQAWSELEPSCLPPAVTARSVGSAGASTPKSLHSGTSLKPVRSPANQQLVQDLLSGSDDGSPPRSATQRSLHHAGAHTTGRAGAGTTASPPPHADAARPSTAPASMLMPPPMPLFGGAAAPTTPHSQRVRVPRALPTGPYLDPSQPRPHVSNLYTGQATAILRQIGSPAVLAAGTATLRRPGSVPSDVYHHSTIAPVQRLGPAIGLDDSGRSAAGGLSPRALAAAPLGLRAAVAAQAAEWHSVTAPGPLAVNVGSPAARFSRSLGSPLNNMGSWPGADVPSSPTSPSTLAGQARGDAWALPASSPDAAILRAMSSPSAMAAAAKAAEEVMLSRRTAGSGSANGNGSGLVSTRHLDRAWGSSAALATAVDYVAKRAQSHKVLTRHPGSRDGSGSARSGSGPKRSSPTPTTPQSPHVPKPLPLSKTPGLFTNCGGKTGSASPRFVGLYLGPKRARRLPSSGAGHTSTQTVADWDLLLEQSRRAIMQQIDEVTNIVTGAAAPGLRPSRADAAAAAALAASMHKAAGAGGRAAHAHGGGGGSAGSMGSTGSTGFGCSHTQSRAEQRYVRYSTDVLPEIQAQMMATLAGGTRPHHTPAHAAQGAGRPLPAHPSTGSGPLYRSSSSLGRWAGGGGDAAKGDGLPGPDPHRHHAPAWAPGGSAEVYDVGAEHARGTSSPDSSETPSPTSKSHYSAVSASAMLPAARAPSRSAPSKTQPGDGPVRSGPSVTAMHEAAAAALAAVAARARGGNSFTAVVMAPAADEADDGLESGIAGRSAPSITGGHVRSASSDGESHGQHSWMQHQAHHPVHGAAPHAHGRASQTRVLEAESAGDHTEQSDRTAAAEGADEDKAGHAAMAGEASASALSSAALGAEPTAAALEGFAGSHPDIRSSSRASANLAPELSFDVHSSAHAALLHHLHQEGRPGSGSDASQGGHSGGPDMHPELSLYGWPPGGAAAGEHSAAEWAAAAAASGGAHGLIPQASFALQPHGARGFGAAGGFGAWSGSGALSAEPTPRPLNMPLGATWQMQLGGASPPSASGHASETDDEGPWGHSVLEPAVESSPYARQSGGASQSHGQGGTSADGRDDEDAAHGRSADEASLQGEHDGEAGLEQEGDEQGQEGGDQEGGLAHGEGEVQEAEAEVDEGERAAEEAAARAAEEEAQRAATAAAAAAAIDFPLQRWDERAGGDSGPGSTSSSPGRTRRADPQAPVHTPGIGYTVVTSVAGQRQDPRERRMEEAQRQLDAQLEASAQHHGKVQAAGRASKALLRAPIQHYAAQHHGPQPQQDVPSVMKMVTRSTPARAPSPPTVVLAPPVVPPPAAPREKHHQRGAASRSPPKKPPTQAQQAVPPQPPSANYTHVAAPTASGMIAQMQDLWKD